MLIITIPLNVSLGRLWINRKIVSTIFYYSKKALHGVVSFAAVFSVVTQCSSVTTLKTAARETIHGVYNDHIKIGSSQFE